MKTLVKTVLCRNIKTLPQFKTKACFASPCYNPSPNKGFTIIELVLVIILIGILAATIAPKLLSSDGSEEYTYQAEVIAVLRSIQLRAMQQATNANHCHTVVVSEKKLSVGDDCSVNQEDSDGKVINNLSVEIDNVNIKFQSLSFVFDGMGRPTSCSVTPCNITINGLVDLTVIIESEGFIHAE